jgi:hypothetical protein
MPRILNDPVGCMASNLSHTDLPSLPVRARDRSSGVSMCRGFIGSLRVSAALARVRWTRQLDHRHNMSSSRRRRQPNAETSVRYGDPSVPYRNLALLRRMGPPHVARMSGTSCLLFFPGTRPELLPRAIASCAGQVCADLEDAVATDATRASVIELLADGGARPAARGAHQPSGHARWRGSGSAWGTWTDSRLHAGQTPDRLHHRNQRNRPERRREALSKHVELELVGRSCRDPAAVVAQICGSSIRRAVWWCGPRCWSEDRDAVLDRW